MSASAKDTNSKRYEGQVAFYHTAAWLRCREGFITHRISIDGGLCQHCGKEPGYIVHHTVKLDANNIRQPEVTLNWDLLEYVCIECHNTEHYKQYKTLRDGLAWTDDGDIIKVEK